MDLTHGHGENQPTQVFSSIFARCALKLGKKIQFFAYYIEQRQCVPL